MAEATPITVRIDTATLAAATSILETHGLSPHDYLRMSVARLVFVGGIPWGTTNEELAVPNIKRAARKPRTKKAKPAQATDELREGLGSE